MFIRCFISIFLFFFIGSNSCYAQKVADFCFCNTEDTPTSLLENTSGADAIGINPNADSNGEGVFTSASENINLTVPASLFDDAESLRLEFDFLNQENFVWLFYAGDERFRFGNKIDGPESTHGLWIRYYTINDEGEESYINSNPIPNSRVALDERALVTFTYNHETGIAQVIKNEEIVWETPEEERTPGEKIFLNPPSDHVVVARNMDGEGSTTPSLYSFRGYLSVCPDITPPLVEPVERCGIGPVRLEASGATEGNYRWYDSEKNLVENEVNSVFNTHTLEETTTFYVSRVEDDCESELIPVQATINPLPAKPEVINAERCTPDSFILHASGATDGNYRWYRSMESENPIEDAYDSSYTTHFLTVSTDFFVSIVDGNCESQKVKVQAVLHDRPSPPSIGDMTVCYEQEVAIETSLAPENIQRWYVSPSITEVLYEDTDGFFNPLVTSDTTFYVSTWNGFCESTRVPVNLQIHTPGEIDAGKDVAVYFSDSIQLSVAQGHNLTNFQWHPATGLDDPTHATPIASPDRTTTYTVTAIDQNGCEVSDEITVFLTDFPIPNAFTPNDDGLNDTWELPMIHRYPDCEVIVYNRWGNLVFHSIGYNEPWDGEHNSQIVQPGTYVYIVDLKNGRDPIKGMLYIRP